jgi:hypothetical protein
MSDANPHPRKPPALWTFFLLALVLLLLFSGVSLWLTQWSPGNAEPEEAARTVIRIKNLADLRADNAKKLEGYAWVDRAKGTVQIPIKQAMELVLPELNNTRPRAAYPVASPAPVVSPTATPTHPAPATP